MKIAAISSKKLGDVNEGQLKNGYLYNDKELFDDADLNWYDYGFRNYDPQIGRFTQLDPLTDEYPELTPYQYAGCEPIGNVDVDGLEGSGVTAVKTLSEVVVTSTLKVASSGTNAGLSLLNAGLHASLMGGINLLNSNTFSIPQPAVNSVHSESSPVLQQLNMQADAQLNNGAGQSDQLSSYCISCETAQMKAESQRKILEWRSENGYNPDGSKHWTTKLAENKHFSRLGSHLVFPIIEMYGGYGVVKGVISGFRYLTIDGAFDFEIQFGKTENQIYHAFRHTDALGLDRTAVQNAIREHFPSVASKLIKGKPLNAIIEVQGQRIKYTAFKLSDGTINIGRIHGIK